MKKTIFEGTVNGKKYSDVNKYNEAVKNILDKGGDLNCSSSTRTVDIDDQPSLESPEAMINKLLAMDSQEATAYLNDLASQCTNKVIKAMDDKDKDSLENILNNLYGFLDGVDDCSDKTEDAVDVMEQKLGELTEQLTKLEEDLKWLEKSGDYFDQLKQLMRPICNDLEDTLDEHEESCKKAPCKCQNKKKDDLQKELKNLIKEFEDFFN